MIQKRIVITGAPGTGKTSVIKQLEKTHFFCFHEVIRTMTQEAKKETSGAGITSNPIISVSEPMEFNLKILKARVQQYKDATQSSENLLFYDRGIPDVLAYMHYFGQNYPSDFIETCKKYTYDTIFILPPWKEIYVCDEERFETYQQAEELHHHLTKIYQDLGYQVTKVPFDTIENRMNFILKNI